MALHCEAANAVLFLFFFIFPKNSNLIFVREERTLACIKTPRRDTNGGGGGGDDEVASTSEPRSLTSTRDKEIGKGCIHWRRRQTPREALQSRGRDRRAQALHLVAKVAHFALLFFRRIVSLRYSFAASHGTALHLLLRICASLQLASLASAS